MAIMSFINGGKAISLPQQTYNELLENEMILFKAGALEAAREEYRNDPGTDEIYQWLVKAKEVKASKTVFVYLACLLGDYRVKRGLPLEGIIAAVSRYGCGSYPEKLAWAKEEIIKMCDPLMKINPEGDNSLENLTFSDNSPFFLLPGGDSFLIVSKEWAKWSPELCYSVEHKRSMLPSAVPLKDMLKASDCPRKNYIPGRHACCGTHFVDDVFGLEVLNILNKQPARINWDILKNCPYRTKKGMNPDGSLKRLEGESDEDYMKRNNLHLAFLASRENLAQLMAEYKTPIYFEHRRHHCFRIFAGYWEFNYQGNDSQKAIIEDAHKMRPKAQAKHTSGIWRKLKGMAAFTTEEYLLLDLANALGYDKLSFEDRLMKVICLKAEYKTWFQIMKLIQWGILVTDEPAGAYSAAKALNAISNGWRIGRLGHLDAASSGAQFISMMTLDIRAAWLSNLFSLDGNKQERENLYLWVYHAFQEYCLKQGEPLDPNLSYRQVKNGALIPWFYGSENGPINTFGERVKQMFDAFMRQMFPGLVWFHDMMTKLHRKDVDIYRWRMPDGVLCETPVIVEQEFPVEFLGEILTVKMKVQSCADHSKMIGANFVQSCDGFVNREMVRSANPPIDKIKWIKENIWLCGSPYATPDNPRLKMLLDCGKAADFYSLQIVFEVNTQMDLASVPREVMEELLSQFAPHKYSIFPIHDCFMATADNGNLIREQYIYNMYKFARSAKIGNWILKQIIGRDVPIAEFFGNRQQFAESILESCNYAIG